MSKHYSLKKMTRNVKLYFIFLFFSFYIQYMYVLSFICEDGSVNLNFMKCYTKNWDFFKIFNLLFFIILEFYLILIFYSIKQENQDLFLIAIYYFPFTWLTPFYILKLVWNKCFMFLVFVIVKCLHACQYVIIDTPIYDSRKNSKRLMVKIYNIWPTSPIH